MGGSWQTFRWICGCAERRTRERSTITRNRRRLASVYTEHKHAPARTEKSFLLTPASSQ